jgi:hypothetical protein
VGDAVAVGGFDEPAAAVVMLQPGCNTGATR